MSTVRTRPDRVSLVVGVGLVTIGTAVWFVPGPVSALPITATLSRVPAPLWLLGVAGVGSMLLLLALLIRSNREVESLAAATGPDVDDEERARPERVGDSMDDAIARATDPSSTRSSRQDAKAALEADLEALAVEALCTYGDLSRDAAETAVIEGQWSTDTRATALLGSEDAPSPPLYVWLADLVRGENTYHRWVRHAVREICALERETINTRMRERDQ